jgi:hypothetical protein
MKEMSITIIDYIENMLAELLATGGHERDGTSCPAVNHLFHVAYVNTTDPKMLPGKMW